MTGYQKFIFFIPAAAFFLFVLLIAGCNRNTEADQSIGNGDLPEATNAAEQNRLSLWPAAEGVTLIRYHAEASDTLSPSDQTLGDDNLNITRHNNGQLEMRWNNVRSSGFRLELTKPLNFSRLSENALFSFDLKADQFSRGGLSVVIPCGADCRRSVRITEAIYTRYLSDEGERSGSNSDTNSGWQEIAIPLSCIVRESDDFSAVTTPFMLEAGGVGAIRVRDIAIVPEGEATIDCPHYMKAAVTPAPLNTFWARDWWMDRHREKREAPDRTSARLVFLGNSITQGWEGDGQAIWNEFYADRDAFNLGFSGDRTENVLWRLHNGEIDGMAPDLVVLMIGTNNTGHRQDPPESVARGIEKILDELESRLPDTRVLLLAIFPHGVQPDNLMRRLNNRINEHIADFDNRDLVRYIDINDAFLDNDGRLPADIMPDFLHPNEKGYRIWAETMEPVLEELLHTGD